MPRLNPHIDDATLKHIFEYATDLVHGDDPMSLPARTVAAIVSEAQAARDATERGWLQPKWHRTTHYFGPVEFEHRGGDHSTASFPRGVKGAEGADPLGDDPSLEPPAQFRIPPKVGGLDHEREGFITGLWLDSTPSEDAYIRASLFHALDVTVTAGDIPQATIPGKLLRFNNVLRLPSPIWIPVRQCFAVRVEAPANFAGLRVDVGVEVVIPLGRS